MFSYLFFIYIYSLNSFLSRFKHIYIQGVPLPSPHPWLPNCAPLFIMHWFFFCLQKNLACLKKNLAYFHVRHTPTKTHTHMYYIHVTNKRTHTHTKFWIAYMILLINIRTDNIWTIGFKHFYYRLYYRKWHKYKPQTLWSTSLLYM